MLDKFVEDASLETLMELHEKYGLQFVIEAGKITEIRRK